MTEGGCALVKITPERWRNGVPCVQAITSGPSRLQVGCLPLQAMGVCQEESATRAHQEIGDNRFPLKYHSLPERYGLIYDRIL